MDRLEGGTVMDRRAFLQSLAAIGLLPYAKIDEILAAPEAVEPAFGEPFRIEFVVGDVRFAPIEMHFHADSIDVSTMDAPEFMSANPSIDFVLSYEDAARLVPAYHEAKLLPVSCSLGGRTLAFDGVISSLTLPDEEWPENYAECTVVTTGMVTWLES